MLLFVYVKIISESHFYYIWVFFTQSIHMLLVVDIEMCSSISWIKNYLNKENSLGYSPILQDILLNIAQTI